MIDEYRKTIDEIDKELINLFEKRLDTVENIVKYKQENNLKIYNKQRELEVLQKNLTRLQNPKYTDYASDFLTAMMDISKDYQSEFMGLTETPLSKTDIIVGFQGVPGSYSEEALIKYFTDDCKTQHYTEFKDVFEALKYGYIDYGVLPIENSTTGSITQNFDLLKQYGYYIVGETSIKIQHHLLGISGANTAELTKVFSHPQGFEQCTQFLNTIPKCEQVAYHNTAISAKFVRDSGNLQNAAVGSIRAAQIYGLEVLEENISNAKENVTRFIIVAKHQESNDLCDKMTLIFSLPNVSGSLYSALNEFSNSGVNLLKIESRPVGDGSFSYYFYIDIEGNKEDATIKEAIVGVSKVVEEFKILGCYKKNV